MSFSEIVKEIWKEEENSISFFIERGPDEYLAGPKWATTEQDWPGPGNVKN